MRRVGFLTLAKSSQARQEETGRSTSQVSRYSVMREGCTLLDPTGPHLGLCPRRGQHDLREAKFTPLPTCFPSPSEYTLSSASWLLTLTTKLVQPHLSSLHSPCSGHVGLPHASNTASLLLDPLSLNVSANIANMSTSPSFSNTISSWH